MGDHAHLRCTGCGVILDIDLEPLPMDQLSAAAGSFEVHDYRVEFLGFCGGCREVQDAERRTQNAE